MAQPQQAQSLPCVEWHLGAELQGPSGRAAAEFYTLVWPQFPRRGALGKVSYHPVPQFRHRQNGDDNHKGQLGELNEVMSAKLMGSCYWVGL